MSSKTSQIDAKITTTTGVLEFELLGAKSDNFPHVNQPDELTKSCPDGPKFAGSVEEFVEEHVKKGKDEKILVRQSKNKVKKCLKCGKPCAFTLSCCNSCGASLVDVKISYTNNVFTGFVFGIKKGPFPYTISKRLESKDILVFDDLLALTPAHVNCIPTNVYIPDVRTLFKKPDVGLALIRKMFDSCWSVISTQFVANKTWSSKMLSTDEVNRSNVAAGFNFPPSQYQLHLQFMLPCFTPFHFKLYVQGHHFTYKRFLPFEYVEKTLQWCVKNKANIAKADEMSIDEIFSFFESKGVSYDTIWRDCYKRYGDDHRRLARWDVQDFDYLAYISHDKKEMAKVFDSSDLSKIKEGVDVEKVRKSDKATLQNYGRPYTKEGRPTGSYYKYAKEPPLPEI